MNKAQILDANLRLANGLLTVSGIALAVPHNECGLDIQADASSVWVSWPRLLTVANNHPSTFFPKHTSLLLLALRASISALFAAQET
jgi:hypothetical protein